MSCYFCRKDIDTLGTLLIVLSYWLGSEALLVAPNNGYYLFPIYMTCFGLSLYFFKYATAKILFVYTSVTASAELYWWHIDYSSKPQIIYFVSLMALTLVIQRLLYNRALIMHDYFNHMAGKLALDGHVRRILNSYFALFALMTFEYLLRHIAGLKSALLIYNIFTPASTLISAFTLTVIYMHYFYNQTRKHQLL